ncbi:glycosyltransferase [uncultured Jatrophihabitans sp.]|uniref:glycosyltransferase n=1 Tax=uncultured Jatrophihabitans sp. TaxID=1610747 RepID=UPI0035C94BE6
MKAVSPMNVGDPLGDSADQQPDVQISPPPPYPARRIIRILVVLNVLLGLNYLVWRWLFSVHWTAWWISVPLILAETYSLIDSLLFCLTVWRLRRREDPGPPLAGVSVDVFITTYDEPVELVMTTAAAAKKIRYPHETWILDDGNRPELREAAANIGVGVISRSEEWTGRNRHAKAGNLNNALMVTTGEFVAILDADQVPKPELLDHTLGYFRDEKMAIVQTPQFFQNVPECDPLGSQAPLFYGPIQAGKDGWNAAFFCGSNAILRREALLQMGIRRYVQELETRIDSALRTAKRVITRASNALPADQGHVAAALREVLDAAEDARADLAAGTVLADATGRFQDRVRAVARRLVEADLAVSQADLAELAELAASVDDPGQLPPVDSATGDEAILTEAALDGAALDRLSRRDWSPLGAIETVRALVATVDVDREDEAQPIMPLSTISVTEDMATCMRVHSMGWKTAYHDEILAVGLAPEDLGTMLTQRLRWAQGTVQVMLRENPLRQAGLSLAQKLMYTATMWSYLSGFAALVYIAAPVIYLVFGVLPVHALSIAFFARLIPFMVANQLLFYLIGRGRRTWRGQQYSLALFPLWIKAVTSACANVLYGRSLAFAVTPKVRVRVEKRPWHLVRPQLIAMAVLVIAAGIGVFRLGEGHATALGTGINLIWVAFDLLLFSVIPRAVRYRGFEAQSDPSPTGDTPAPHDHVDTVLENSK